MKLFQVTKIDPYIVLTALSIALLPIYGLLSETAISVGLYGSNYQEIALQDDPQRYWFIIQAEWYITLWIFILSFIRFPFIETAQNKISLYRKKHKIKFLLIAFLLIPVIATILIILVMAILSVP